MACVSDIRVRAQIMIHDRVNIFFNPLNRCTFSFATRSHFACCLGDTLASELGILSKSPPILITSFSRVPPGTNGGVSLVGTLASLSGGVVMGLTVAASLIWESSACRQTWPALMKELVLVGAAAGLFGSFVSSARNSRFCFCSHSIALYPKNASPSFFVFVFFTLELI